MKSGIWQMPCAISCLLKQQPPRRRWMSWLRADNSIIPMATKAYTSTVETRSRVPQAALFDITTSPQTRAATPSKIPRSRGIGSGAPLSPELLRKMDAWSRAANYLSVGQIYLFDNPLLKKLLKREHVKPRLLGHWGSTPGL